MFVYQFDNRCLAFFICHFLQFIFLIDLWGSKMLCFGWLCHYMPEAYPFLWVEFFAGFSMVDSTKFSIEAQIFQKFFIKCLLFKDRNH